MNAWIEKAAECCLLLVLATLVTGTSLTVTYWLVPDVEVLWLLRWNGVAFATTGMAYVCLSLLEK